MFPHLDTLCEVREMQRQEWLTGANLRRVAADSAGGHERPISSVLRAIGSVGAGVARFAIRRRRWIPARPIHGPVGVQK